jgi:4-hydroxy-4-methyl-2-oxoglutarate aldolase
MSIDNPVGVLSGLYVAVIADTLDRLGYRDQVMDHSIRPQVDGFSVLIGRAHTIAAVRDEDVPENPYEHEIAAVDAVGRDEIIVVETGGALDVSIWGELLATRADARGFAGAVTDGGVRDLAGLRRLGRPTFSASISARDSRGRLRVTGSGVPVSCGGVTVEAGDVIMADLDGVVVIPAALTDEVAAHASAKVDKEDLTRDALRGGASAAEVYAEHGVL